jgi:hypothetical protein
MPKRCYVSMPFGTKPISDGTPHDFDWVYAELVEPAVKMADYDPIYLKNFFSNASILDTIIKLVSESEAMIVDITGKNPNVMYELGIRHAFVPTGTLMIQRDDELKTLRPFPFFRLLISKIAHIGLNSVGTGGTCNRVGEDLRRSESQHCVPKGALCPPTRRVPDRSGGVSCHCSLPTRTRSLS